MLLLLKFLGIWLLGQGLLFLWIKNKNHALTFHDVLESYMLSTAVGLVCSYAASKVNINFWFPAIAYLGLSSYLTYKLIEKGAGATVASAQGFLSTAQSKYPSGSMGAADQKANAVFILTAGVIYLLIILCLTAFGTDLHAFYHRQGPAVHLIGIILIIVSYLLILGSSTQALSAKQGVVYWLVIVALLALGITVSCGFNFDYFGIK